MQNKAGDFSYQEQTLKFAEASEIIKSVKSPNSPPTEILIESGVVAKLITFLEVKNFDLVSEMTVGAALIGLRKIAGRSHNSLARVLDCGLVEELLRLVRSATTTIEILDHLDNLIVDLLCGKNRVSVSAEVLAKLAPLMIDLLMTQNLEVVKSVCASIFWAVTELEPEEHIQVLDFFGV